MTIGNSNSNIVLNVLQDYWNELSWACGDDTGSVSGLCPIPQRLSFNPMKIHRQLQHVYIGELKSDDFLEVRLSGTAIDADAGFSLKGSNYLDICPPVDRKFYVAICKAVVGWPCGMKMVRRVTLKNGRIHQYSSLSLPLSDCEGVPRYIVGMVNIAKDIAHGGFPYPEKMTSQISDFQFLDIGAGVPPLPDFLRL